MLPVQGWLEREGAAQAVEVAGSETVSGDSVLRVVLQRAGSLLEGVASPSSWQDYCAA